MLHAVNNVLVFVLAGALGEGVATEEVPGRARAGCSLLVGLGLAAYVALVAAARRRLRPETRTARRRPADPRPPPCRRRPR